MNGTPLRVDIGARHLTHDGRTAMDLWKFFDITHREHVILNPTSSEKLDELIGLLRIRVGAPVLDLGCGKAELLIRLATARGARCTGVDLSHEFVEQARARIARHAPDADITLLEMNGADFKPDRPHSFALASCLGASWIFGGHAGTLDALMNMVEPGGWIVVGEPYWIQEPTDDYLKVLEQRREDFGTHASNAEAGTARGLDLVYTFASNPDEWDRYEGLQWYGAVDYARTNPEDPDIPELLARVARNRAAYLQWGRETLGWAMYVFRARG